MKLNIAGAAVAALFLSACAHSYPDLATFKPSLSDERELRTILDEAADLQRKYSAGYKETAKWQDLSQLPIIGAATVAAWVLLNDKANAATKAAKIGIGTASYSAARGQLSAAGLPEAYIAGHGALTCILSEGSYFDGLAAQRRYGSLDAQLKAIATGLQKTTALRYKQPADAGSHADALRLAHTIADQAIAAARAAETAGLTQEGHFLSAAPTFRNAVSNVSVRVASKGRVRPPVDFDSLRDKMAPPKPLDGAGGADVLPAFRGDDAQSIIAALMAETERLTSTTARLIAATPNYLKSLERVQECPKLVS